MITAKHILTECYHFEGPRLGSFGHSAEGRALPEDEAVFVKNPRELYNFIVDMCKIMENRDLARWEKHEPRRPCRPLDN